MLPLLTIVLPSDATAGHDDGGDSGSIGGDQIASEQLFESGGGSSDSGYNEASFAADASGDLSLSDLEQPSMEDTSSVGGWVWIVMFGFVMSLSLASNLVFAAATFSNRRTRTEPVYLLLLLMFLVNVADYSLLSFEFSLGVEHVFPYGEAACTTYQVALRSMPILQAMSVVVLLHYTAAKFIVPASSNSTGTRRQSHRLFLRWPFNRMYRELPTSSSSTSTSSGSSATSGLLTFAGLLSVMLLLCGLFALPTAFFARTIVYEGQRYCEIDLSSVAAGNGGDVAGLQMAVSTYYLIYSALLSYWFPLLASLPALHRLYRSRRQVESKSPEVSVALSTSASFFIFFALHGGVVAVRHTIDAAGISISTYQSWMLKVIQSLFWLVAYFWHFARAALAVLLDPDLKDWAMRPTIGPCCCTCQTSGDGHDGNVGVDSAGGNECQMPLCFVMQPPPSQSETKEEKELVAGEYAPEQQC